MALSTHRASSSAPAAHPHWKFHVFLSFRGEDTRKGFTDHLYNKLNERGIKTFRDKPELHKGTTINTELLKEIEQSRFAIVVFSKNYASSTWCLRELAHIVQCMKEKERIFPIFYDVEPYVVRSQKGSYEEAFTKHETELGKDTKEVLDWRNALTTVANLAGWGPKDYMYDTVLIKEVVNQVWDKVHPTLLGSTDIVRIDSRLKKINSLIEAEAKDVRFIGIHGMGGIGKTTIARSVDETQSHNFDFRIFLQNVKEHKSHKLVQLQQKLLSPILKEKVTEIGDVYNGRSMIKNCLGDKKILLILDDVDKLDQLENLVGGKDWFGLGSRILITTRDQRLLVQHDIEHQYEVVGLDKDDALKLFSWKAFKKERPDEEFSKLSECVLHYAAGLPLALTTLGSSLYKRDRDSWQSMLDKLKKVPEKDSFKILKISYDGLTKMEQEVFLHVACFFRGKSVEMITRRLDYLGYNARITIDVLIEKSLLSISEYKFESMLSTSAYGYDSMLTMPEGGYKRYLNQEKEKEIDMHDLMQEMGREIVRQESKEAEGRSRLWRYDEMCQIFNKKSTKKRKNSTETEAIPLPAKTEAILMTAENGCWNPNALCKMSKLKFLRIDGCVLLEDLPAYLPSSLRVLDWSFYPSKSLPPRFKPVELVELRMKCSKIKELWHGEQNLNNLKCLDLSECRSLTKTPDFTGVPNLERLIIWQCWSLVDIHPSIAYLRRLRYLDFSGCESIKSLPSEVGMESLEVFILTGCSNLKRVPEFVGQMNNLSILNLSATFIENLPSSVERLIGLVSLNLYCCFELSSLPASICSLKSLRELNLTSCFKLRTLPQNLGEIESLEKLYLRDSSLENLPSSIALMKNLKVLSLAVWRRASSDVAGLPSLKALCSLKQLDMDFCNLRDEDISDDIGSLSCLEVLILSGNDFESLPESIQWLCNLKFLDLKKCKRLKKLPELPPSRDLTICASECHSLQVQKLGLSRLVSFYFLAGNCSLLHFDDQIDLMLREQFLQGLRHSVEFYHILMPGYRIPEWYSNKREGNSLIWEPPQDFVNQKRLVFALCVVVGNKGASFQIPFKKIGEIQCCVQLHGSEPGETLYHIRHLSLSEQEVSLLYFTGNYFRSKIRNFSINSTTRMEIKFKCHCENFWACTCHYVIRCGIHVFEDQLL